jgi:hypothetical protein
MRKISQYEEYIIENKLAELLLEAKISYKSDFIKILNNIKDVDRIAAELLKLQNEEVDVMQNKITLGEKNDVILFTPNKKGGKMKTNDSSRFIDDIAIFDRVMPNWRDFNCVRIAPVGTVGTVLLSVDHPYSGIPISFFVFDGDERKSACLLPNTALESVEQMTMSVGRFVNRLLTVSKISFTTKELETFVNNFKAQYDMIINETFKDLKLVKGLDIRKYYSANKYSEPSSGTLWNSCMSYDRCQSFLDIYVENPNVQLLILKNEEDKIRGRALVWKLDDPDRTFMDRVYTINDSDINLFIDYAKRKNWLYKDKQSSDILRISEGPKVSCSLYKGEEDMSFLEAMQYPYMDTLCYLSDSGYLSNSSLSVVENSKVFYLILRTTDGSYSKRII